MNKKLLLPIIIIPFVVVIGLLLSPNISHNTGNPSECWYKDEDGILKPCYDDSLTLYSKFEGEKYIENPCKENQQCIGIIGNNTEVILECDFLLHCPKIPLSP